jgi:hypothetical protein
MGRMQRRRDRVRLVALALGVSVAVGVGAPAGAQALAWSGPVRVDSHGERASVACSSAVLCTTVDARGYESTFAPDPRAADPVSDRIDTGNQSALGCSGFGPCPLDAVACPSLHLCVAVDRHGQVLTGDPGHRWHAARLSAHARMEGVACRSVS